MHIFRIRHIPELRSSGNPESFDTVMVYISISQNSGTVLIHSGSKWAPGSYPVVIYLASQSFRVAERILSLIPLPVE